MAKKKSSLSQALQNAQLQQQRALKLAAKKLTQQQKQPKHLSSQSKIKPSDPSQPVKQNIIPKTTQSKAQKTKNCDKAKKLTVSRLHETQDADSRTTQSQIKIAEITRNDSQLQPTQPSEVSLSSKNSFQSVSHDLETLASDSTSANAEDEPHPVSREERSNKTQTRPHLTMVNKDDQVLLVGEGNFSFTVLLLVEYSHPGRLITASTIDSKETVLKKYPDSESILELLEQNKVTILFELDGCKLNEDKRIKRSKIKFDKVIFNFPHVGGSEPDQDRNVRANQILILRFLRSVSTLLFQPEGVVFGQDQDRKKKRSKTSTKASKKLKSHQKRPNHSSAYDSDDSGRIHSDQESGAEPDLHVRKPGTVLITAGTCPPYSFWDVPALAKNGNTLAHTILYPTHPNLKQKGEQPVYKLIRSFNFEKSIDSTGSTTYQHRQTNGFKNTQKETRPANARTWEFELLRA
ncbi:hypothetical protein PtA15_12A85 [Puccinia triticina]|uniref:25S rRNA (uridine-N(3))-methyltransferase BMT5-like domain-containing protein n=1 Tax=Puccinia triticina TaxID=208348 RepID=A0ABY7CYS1_9BASI|nr:uncharacterized protein PtA15_12A85 [Puccinia triticina]WAQ90100.1 hypothetical protein PtA15_12A85 [Puccinia triticina]WAR61388.1 hypothetical protein PtB15_12B73 [Puccinia triticina]